MKRKPPAHNVRRVRAIDGNSRYAIVNKCRRTVQCESFQEYKLVLLLERDPLVKDYVSQPETLRFHNDKGREVTYTPDFQVWYVNGGIALHEVTVEARRIRETQKQREQAARTICVARGWRYVVHTEATLPTGGELANLQLLFGFRASGFANPLVAQALAQALPLAERVLIGDLVGRIGAVTHLVQAQILPAVLHQLWHGQLQTSWQQMLFQDAVPHPAARIWREA